MQCVGAAASAAEAAALIGGPFAYAAYRAARRRLGLPDTSAAAEAERERLAAAGEAPPAPARRSAASWRIRPWTSAHARTSAAEPALAPAAGGGMGG